MNSYFVILLILFQTEFTSQNKWWKGNLHSHSFWSDGNDYPESIVLWYKNNGYNFLAISDHNILAEGEKWIEIDSSEISRKTYEKYLALFDLNWVEHKMENNKMMVRLKTYDEYKPVFEKENHFLLIKSEEITDNFENKPVHVNATNIKELIRPRSGKSIRDVLQNNIDAVNEQRKKTKQSMFPHINHPNFGWAITAEDIIATHGEKFFEVYNGHPLVNNFGDSLHPDTDKLWDIILTERLSSNKEIIYGLAVDDAHQYHEFKTSNSNPGRGWIMVRTSELNTDSIINAMERGYFYSTTGVEISDIKVDQNSIAIQLKVEEGITYKTKFIGTKKNYKRINSGITKENSPTEKAYNGEIGEVLLEVEGTSPSFKLKGDEIYVRAKIISSKLKANPYKEGEYETAWIQPFIIK